MARLTLPPTVAFATGRIGRNLLRKQRSNTLLVLAPVITKPPTAAQLKHRAAWTRLELLIRDLSPEYKHCMQYEADAAGVDLHRWYLANHLSDESRYGYSALCPANDYPPPVEDLIAVTGPLAGWIMVTYTPLPPDSPFTIGATCRKVPAAGQPALTTFAQQIFPGPQSTVGAFALTGLQTNTLYSLSAHYIPHMIYRTGTSSTQLEIKAK